MIPRRMRAAVLHGREDVRIEEVEVPRLKPGDLLVRTTAALTCGTDVKVWKRGYHARMIVPPALFGHELAGTVEAVGGGAPGFTPGERVIAANSAPCGRCEFCIAGRESLCDDLLFWNGAYAEFVRIPARVASCNVLRIPDALADHQAAIVEPLACVLRAVASVRRGHSVCVIGTGGIGLMFVALAKALGASVVAVGRKAEKLARASALGADATVVAGDDLSGAMIAKSTGGRGYHLVVEAVGQPHTSEAALAAVRKGGTVNLFAGCAAGTRLRLDATRVHYEEITVSATFHHTPESVRDALRLVADGVVNADAFLSGCESLERLPAVLAEADRVGDALKTVIVP